MTFWLPVALKLEGRRCLVVGEGEDADGRARAFAEAGAEVVRAATFAPELLEGVWLAVLSTRDREQAAQMDRECDARRIFFSAVDEPAFGTYSHLALARAGTVTVAVGTNGEAPALARRLRELVEGLFARANMAEFAAQHAELRRATPPAERREVLGNDVRDVRLDGELVLPRRGPD